MTMLPTPKKKDYQDMVDEYLAKGGKVTQLETKEMPYELGISNHSWGNKDNKPPKKEG